MIKEEDLRNMIKDEFSRMQGSSYAKEIEFVKKTIKKEVGLLQRSSFLAYLFTQLHRREILAGASDDRQAKPKALKPDKRRNPEEGFRQSSAGQDVKQADRSEFRRPEPKIEEQNAFERPSSAVSSASSDASSGDSFEFWCNLKLYNKSRIEEFLRFVEKESGIPEGTAFDFKSLKSFSFFKIREPHALKVKEHFAQPANYNGIKVVIRVKGERGDRK